MDDLDTLFPAENAPPWRLQVLTRLRELMRLSYNWNLEGALPLDEENVVHAVTILASAPNTLPRPWIIPGVGGYVCLEWHTDNLDVEVEVNDNDGMIILFTSRAPAIEYETEGEASLRILPWVLDTLSTSVTS